MPEQRQRGSGGESGGGASKRDGRARDWFDLDAGSGEDLPVKRRADRKEQLNVWLANDSRLQRRKGAEPRVSVPLILVILGPDYEPSAAARQKADARKQERPRFTDENAGTQTPGTRGRSKTLRRVRGPRKANGSDQNSATK
jgi:hypothetical protein